MAASNEDLSVKFPEKYWPLETDARLAHHAWKRWKEYQDWLKSSGKLQAMRDSADMYYCRDADGKGWSARRVRRNSRNPGILRVKSNHYGSTARAKVTLITSKPLSFQVITTNTDADAIADATVGTALLEYVKRTKDLERVRKTLARHGINYGFGFVSWDWDKSEGEEIDPANVPPGELDYALDDNGDPIVDEQGVAQLASIPHYGDLLLRNHTPVDVAYDFTCPDNDVRWYILRHWESRYDLAEKYPAKRREIMTLTPEKSDEWRLSSYFEGLKPKNSSDLIPVYRLVHRKSPACPDGREAYFLNDSIMLEAGRLEYPKLPLARFAPEDTDDSPDGHSDMLDQMGLQESIDATLSTALTKQQASLPKPFVSMQANIGKKNLGGGLEVFTVNGDPNQVVNFVEYDSTHDKDITLAQHFRGEIEMGTGINSVMRGNPNDTVKAESGRAYAFIQAQAAINNASPEGNLRDACGDIGMGVIDTYRKFHRAQQQLVVITGKSREAQALKFIGQKNLQGVRAVVVEQGDALTGTPAGRLELLSMMKDFGVEGIDFNKVMAIATEGRWETLVEDTMNVDAHVRTENEALSKGQRIVPLEGENHLKHILGHLALANRPGCPPLIAANAMMHVRYHLFYWRIADPALLQVIGLPAIPPDPLFGQKDPMTGQPIGPGGIPPPGIGPDGRPLQGAPSGAGAPGMGAPPAPPPQMPGGGGPPGTPPGTPHLPEMGQAGQPGPQDVQPGLPTLPNGQRADPTNQGRPPFPEVENA